MSTLLRPTLREVSAIAVFTISHVHVPKGRSGDFQQAARWLLPRCRVREAANGQGFEHLHLRAYTPHAGPYSYKPQNVGFEPQNVGRGSVISAADAVEVDELVWLEEWADWEGVEKHGGTGHGSLFHSKVDGFIEEEWSFYQPPEDAAPVMLPETAFFNNPAKRGELHICHLCTSSADERTALLAHSAETLSASASWGAFAVILENKFRKGEFAFIAESERDVINGDDVLAKLARLGLASRMEDWVAEAPCSEAGDVLRFGPPLWPEDMAMTSKDIGEEGSDAGTFPDIS